MEAQVSRLVDKVWDKLLHTPLERRLCEFLYGPCICLEVCP